MKKILFLLSIFPISGNYSFVLKENNIKFHQIYILGDSLSDTGGLVGAGTDFVKNNYLLPHLNKILMDGPYYKNRSFSNGPVAVEYLAKELNFNLVPSWKFSTYFESYHYEQVGNNYAVGGMQIGDNDSWYGYFVNNRLSVPNQLRALESHHKIQTDDLIILEAGSNNLLAAIEESKTEKSLAIINTAINSEDTVIRKLLADGARHIVVTDEPNLGLVPRYYETNKQENASLWSQNYNEKWNKMLNKIKVDYPNAIRKYEFSKAFSKYQDLFKKEGKNTTQSAIKSIFRTLLTSGKITTEYINGAKPETLNDFFFLDEVPPTSLVQKMVGVDMIQLVKNWN